MYILQNLPTSGQQLTSKHDLQQTLVSSSPSPRHFRLRCVFFCASDNDDFGKLFAMYGMYAIAMLGLALDMRNGGEYSLLQSRFSLNVFLSCRYKTIVYKDEAFYPRYSCCQRCCLHFSTEDNCTYISELSICHIATCSVSLTSFL
jgi:hypothetical protein